MEALEFFKARKRMCEATKCNSCKLYHVQGGCCIAPDHEKIDAYEEAIAIVERWAKEHPVKTMQSEFLKQFPETELTQDGVITICPVVVSAAYRTENGLCANPSEKCDDCRRKFWLAEVKL